MQDNFFCFLLSIYLKIFSSGVSTTTLSILSVPNAASIVQSIRYLFLRRFKDKHELSNVAPLTLIIAITLIFLFLFFAALFKILALVDNIFSSCLVKLF